MSNYIRIQMDVFRKDGVLNKRRFFEAINDALDIVCRYGGTINVVRRNENEPLSEEALYIWQDYRWYSSRTDKFYCSFRKAWRGETKIETDQS